MRTWNYIDKSDWPHGEWMDEPDKVHWVHNGLDCLIVRSRSSGGLCGYVGVPKSHKYYEMDYNDVYDQPDCKVECHGGLTFSGPCRPVENEQGLCHPKEGAANEKVWWLGFDCAHAWDVSPMDDWSFAQDSMYRHLAYVKLEVEYLADQLSEK